MLIIMSDRDFRAISRMLLALQALNDRRRSVNSTDGWLGKVESALEALEDANSHLMTGAFERACARVT